jgi:two-component sensor histidine kinase
MSISLGYPDGGEKSAPRSSVAAIVSAEADHRIANSLSIIAGLVRMNRSTVVARDAALSVADACALLDEVADRIAAVGQLHRMMARTVRGGSLDLGDYLHDVAEGLSATLSFAGRVAPMRCLLCACSIGSERALWIGLVVGEAITNAIKYAHPSGVPARISVGCQRLPGGGVAVDVRDDGIGFPEGFDPHRDGGLGLRLVRTLAHRLRGRVEFSDDGLGLRLRLIAPEHATN